MTTFEAILPDFWASALINDDFDGLSLDDVKSIDAWLEANGSPQCLGVETESSPGFMTYHDAHSVGVLACNTYVFTFTEGN